MRQFRAMVFPRPEGGSVRAGLTVTLIGSRRGGTLRGELSRVKEGNLESPDDSKSASDSTSAVAKAILDVVSSVPTTSEAFSNDPRERGRSLGNTAALRTAAVSGTLALPPGPLGVVTLVPDLIAVWRIQAQMVADIGGAFGKTASLTQEQMLYCLFRHAAAQLVRDLGVRLGERIVFRPLTMHVMKVVAAKLGIKVTERLLAKSAARWLPVLGSLGVAAYAYYDTAQVAATAIDLFERHSENESDTSA